MMKCSSGVIVYMHTDDFWGVNSTPCKCREKLCSSFHGGPLNILIDRMGLRQVEP